MYRQMPRNEHLQNAENKLDKSRLCFKKHKSNASFIYQHSYRQKREKKLINFY